MRKQPFFYFFFLSSIIVTILVTACNDQSAENKANDGTAGEQIALDSARPVPRMWISARVSKDRETNFDTIRWKFKASCGIEERQYLFYKVDAFKKMIEHFRSLKYDSLDVIIADDSSNKLTLIYQPISKIGRMSYYTLPDNASDFKPTDTLTREKAKKMIDAYRKGNCKMKILKEIIDKEDSLNYIGGNKLNIELFYNTLSILHTRVAIEEMIEEIQYQGTLNNYVSGIRAIFAMIGKNGLESGSYPGRYRYRLNVHFDFTKRNGNDVDEVFYIDTTGRGLIQNPQPAINKREENISPNEKKGLDKGQLCPAHCPEVGDGK